MGTRGWQKWQRAGDMTRTGEHEGRHFHTTRRAGQTAVSALDQRAAPLRDTDGREIAADLALRQMVAQTGARMAQERRSPRHKGLSREP